MNTIADGVIRRFERQWIEPVLAEQLPRASVFHGLNAEQTARLANPFQQRRFLSGDWIIR